MLLQYIIALFFLIYIIVTKVTVTKGTRTVWTRTKTIVITIYNSSFFLFIYNSNKSYSTKSTTTSSSTTTEKAGGQRRLDKELDNIADKLAKKETSPVKDITKDNSKTQNVSDVIIESRYINNNNNNNIYSIITSDILDVPQVVLDNKTLPNYSCYIFLIISENKS